MLKYLTYPFILLAIFSNNVFSSNLLFDARVDYDAGNVPQSVFSADLDGDGDNDLAVANSGLPYRYQG